MSTSVVKRVGDPVTFTWEYPPAQQPNIDEFRLESSPSPTGTFSVVAGGIPPGNRSKQITAEATLYYRVAAVKGGVAASYAGNLTQVIIDNTPYPPTNFQVE